MQPLFHSEYVQKTAAETFAFDPASVVSTAMDGSHYHAAEYQRQMQERGLGTLLFGWDGDQMAWESEHARQRTVHYVFEPNSFVPVLQARAQERMTQSFLKRPAGAASTYVDAQGDYDLDQDPLYNGMYEPGIGSDGEAPGPLTDIHYYQCDHLGTPMELTDEDGNIAWEANYKAWGEARLLLSRTAHKAGLKNPIRFQGQYLDEETGLHYNRFRYYDPLMGRFVSKDPIRLAGGIHLQQYAPNPTEWIDPWGLAGYSASMGNTAGQDTLARGVHVNIQGPGLPKKGGHIGVTLTPDGRGLTTTPVDAATRNLSQSQLESACTCAINFLNQSKIHPKIAKQAQAGIDRFPGTDRAGQLTAVRDLANKGMPVR